MSGETLVFVYGTLKRGGSNHAFLGGQTFLGEARTVPGFQLYELNGYPGMVAENAPRAEGVTGEVWSVDAGTLKQLDLLEGIAEGLYRREPLPLLPPFNDRVIESYLYSRSVAGRRELGSTWTEKPV
jgi:gamma-glutamylaminecyclotransferase